MKAKSKSQKSKEVVGKRYFWVSEDVFKQKVHVLLNFTAEDYAKWLTKMKVRNLADNVFKNFSGFSTVMEAEDKPDEYLIVLRKFDWTIKDQGTLIHEIVHTIIKIWKSNNIPYDDHTQEFLAHEIANMYEDVAAKIFFRKKRKI